MTDDKSEKHKTGKPFYTGFSFWSLITANLIVLIWAVLENQPFSVIFWIYFSQNIILGIFWSIKVFDSPVDSFYIQKVKSLAVFMPHFFLMHFLYAIGLYIILGPGILTNYKNILAMSGIFFLSETVSYFVERTSGRTRQLSLAQIQLFPYARVIPAHFIMFLVIPFQLVNKNTPMIIMSFLLLKTIADVGMHLVGQNLVLGKTVTDFFERHKQSALFSEYTKPSDEQEVCRFCEREIAKNEKHWLIKENIVCTECYKKIAKEMVDSD
jgi:hypothetical protein